jgi:hypothetical protein
MGGPDSGPKGHGVRRECAMTLRPPEDKKARGMITVLKDKFPANFSAQMLSHHHDIGSIARFGRKAGILAPLGECIESISKMRRISAFICTDLHNDFRHFAPEVPSPLPPT